LPRRRDFLLASGAALLEARSNAQNAGAQAPSSSKKIRLGVVGGGFGATFHWHEHPNCVVAAVTDLYADRRDRLRNHYKCDFVYPSLEEMLRRAEKLDAVAVFSGALDHYKHVEMCMKRGLHVVSACPAVFTLEEAEKLKALKEQTGLKYMMAESSYYRQACIYARNLFRQGGFGNIFYNEVEYYHDAGEREQLERDRKSRLFERDGSPSWRFGLPPMHYPTHSLGFSVGVTGERIESVSCLGWGKPTEQTTRNQYKNPFYNESALMRTTRGNMVRCNVFWLVGITDERAQWFGEKGTLYMANQGINPDVWKDLRKAAEPVKVPDYWNTDMLPAPMRHSSGHGGSAVFISAEFINALVEDREPVIDVYESLAMTVPGIVAHQSAMKNGLQMKVPQFEKKA